jgi:hypothetical protein
MKKFNELDLGQQSKALKFIEDELKVLMQDATYQNFFKKKENCKEIRKHIKKIANETVYDNNGDIMVEESLRN